MTTALIKNNNPISHALTNVFELFNVDREAEILLPQSSPEEIGQLFDKYDQSNGNLCVAYFNLLSKKSQGKDWKSNTYRFWCGFFKELGLGYEGSDVACLISQIKQRNERTTASEFSKKLFDYIKSYVEENQEKAELKKYICGNNKDKWHRVTVKVIEDEDFSFARAAHDSKTPGEKEDIILRLSYLVTALRESILWGFKAEGKNEKSDVLIIDDRLYGLEYASYKVLEKPNNPEEGIIFDIFNLLNICEALSVNCYGIGRHEDSFQKDITYFLNNKEKNNFLKWEVKKVNGKGSSWITPVNIKKKFIDCDYILVDLWHANSSNIRGLSLISELHYKIQERVRKSSLSFKKPDDNDVPDKMLPEILAYSLSDDNETIQMAHRMGAAGYVVKRIAESFVLAMVRAGAPLTLKDATLVDFLSSNNFPVISRLPKQIVKNLYHKKIVLPDKSGQLSGNPDLEWLRKIPKSDLHVHFGTAIPIKWCYFLSLLSLTHWNEYWDQTMDIDKKDKLRCIAKRLLKIINNAVKSTNKNTDNDNNFRREFLSAFSSEYNTSEIVFLKDAILYLVKLSDDKLTDKQIACLINVLLGIYGLENGIWKTLNKEAFKRLYLLKGEVKKEDNSDIHNLVFNRDCRYLINGIKLSDCFFEKEKANLNKLIEETGIDELLDKIKIQSYCSILERFFGIKSISDGIDKINFDPLSEMLATDVVEHPYGLERYLAASDLVGSSLLQFTDTLLLASMSVPEWVAGQKRNGNGNIDKNDSKFEDNVIHLELRTTPQGFLQPYGYEMNNSSIAGQLICVGLEFGIKRLLKKYESVSAQLLLSIKRDRKREHIIDLIRTAVDMRDDYKRFLEKSELSDVEGYMIPHVIGLDVAGIERNNLPSDLQPYYHEAFKRCLLSTVHAGETESADSVKEAIFMLNASRIGHGLSIKNDGELLSMVGDRDMCVELCPKSNQFTNGFPVFSIHDKIKEGYVYVYNDFRGKLLQSISTDNPIISHKASNCASFAYPLSEEFIWLSGMIDNNQEQLSRLEVLYLICNGFLSMFAPDQAIKYIIALADDEVLALIAEEYLDIDMSN